MEQVSKLTGHAAFWAVVISSVLVALVSYRFVPLGVKDTMDFVSHNLAGNSLALYGHIALAPVALLLMPFQFMSGLRQKHPAFHRWMGRAYVACVVVSGVAGFQLAFHSTAGSFAMLGFASLAVVWLWTSLGAFYFALDRKFDKHRNWMLRSAALTFAAVTLRLYLGSSMALGADFQVAYPIISWACWVPNAMFVELYLLKNKLRNTPAAKQTT